LTSRAKRLSIHPDSMVTLCPHRAKKLHPSTASHTALGYLSEAVVRYLHPRLITPAVCITYAIILYKRAAPQQRHFSSINSVQTIKSRHLRSSSLRVVIECSRQRRGFGSLRHDVQVSTVRHTMLTCASLNCLKLID